MHFKNNKGLRVYSVEAFTIEIVYVNPTSLNFRISFLKIELFANVFFFIIGNVDIYDSFLSKYTLDASQRPR